MPTPEKLLPYKTLPEWTQGAIPAGFQRPHNTKDGTWAQLRVLAGSLDFALTDKAGEVLQRFTFTPDRQPPLIQPQQWHQILSTSADVRCQLQFLCTPEDYFSKKHDMTRTHSEVVEAFARLHPTHTPPRALDVGCGQGRNSLYLALQGWQVDALDYATGSLQTLAALAEHEDLQARIRTHQADLNQAAHSAVLPRPSGAAPDAGYDLVVCTVVLMFLQPQAVDPLIAQMQAATAPGGCNLIVCAMDAPDAPCTQPFPFTFKPGELSARYAGWDLLKYNENPGNMHATDAQGRPIGMRFATLLARKP